MDGALRSSLILNCMFGAAIWTSTGVTAIHFSARLVATGQLQMSSRNCSSVLEGCMANCSREQMGDTARGGKNAAKPFSFERM